MHKSIKVSSLWLGKMIQISKYLSLSDFSYSQQLNLKVFCALFGIFSFLGAVLITKEFILVLGLSIHHIKSAKMIQSVKRND